MYSIIHIRIVSTTLDSNIFRIFNFKPVFYVSDIVRLFFSDPTLFGLGHHFASFTKDKETKFLTNKLNISYSLLSPSIYLFSPPSFLLYRILVSVECFYTFLKWEVLIYFLSKLKMIIDTSEVIIKWESVESKRGHFLHSLWLSSCTITHCLHL